MRDHVSDGNRLIHRARLPAALQLAATLLLAQRTGFPSSIPGILVADPSDGKLYLVTACATSETACVSSAAREYKEGREGGLLSLLSFTASRKLQRTHKPNHSHPTHISNMVRCRICPRCVELN